MATTTYLSNPVVTINAVALTGYATAATLTRTNTAQDTTVFGLTARVYSATIEDNTLTVSLFLTYEATTSVYAALLHLLVQQPRSLLSQLLQLPQQPTQPSL